MTTLFDKLIFTLILLLTIIIAIIAFVLAYKSFPVVFELLKQIGSDNFYVLLETKNLKSFQYFMLSVASLIALLTYLREKTKLKNEREENRSRIFLELAKDGLKGAYDMLSDQNNTRIIWVRAARDILHSENLAKEIKTPQYHEAYQLFKEKIRHKLYLALTIEDENGHRQALPPQFFYGVSDLKKEISLDDAAKETSSKMVTGSMNINENMKEPSSTPLSKETVVAIFNFLEFPKDYDDPLKKVKVWSDGWEGSFGISQGAKRFVHHITHFHAINGELIPMKKEK